MLILNSVVGEMSINVIILLWGVFFLNCTVVISLYVLKKKKNEMS